ncbi:brain-enriched guanylate kinase-associated protein [Eulemur rufifrons]|uniref:brain-enriched guanylate kinase-associated protein n=1 Tax=Eulemur rufifrons TaxID=859984 RepID=UPI003743A4B4
MGTQADWLSGPWLTVGQRYPQPRPACHHKEQQGRHLEEWPSRAPGSTLGVPFSTPPPRTRSWSLKPLKATPCSVLSAHRLRSPWVPSCLGQSRVLQGRLARSSPSLWDSDLEEQEQKGELRKRLSYTTHRLEKLENEFDSTRHFLEIELRRAQEELEKVTEKLRRIQNHYTALQRINQELEDKLYRMGQHYEEEKRALSHEIVALNSHLLEAKMTIQKLTEENELYRKDCNLAVQLLLCTQPYGRVHKVSELPLDFQERLSLHLEKHGCSLPASLCHPPYADSVPICVIAKVLEKPEPSSLSSQLSDASAGDLAFCEEIEKPGPQPPYKGDIYCSDPSLYCPEEPERDRRPSVDASVSEAGFLQGQNSTDSTAEEEEEAEAAAYPASFQHEAFAGYEASLPTSSSYSSFSAASEEKEHGQASTLSSQQPVYLSSRDELFRRRPRAAYESSTRFGSGPAAAPREAGVGSRFGRALPSYQADSFQFPIPGDMEGILITPNLWSLRAKPVNARLAAGDMRAHWRPPSVEDIGTYSYPARNPRRLIPGSFSERYFGVGRGSAGNKSEGRGSPFYANYKADSFSEGDDLSQGHLADACFLRACGELSLSPSRSDDPLPSYEPSEGDGDRLGVQLCGGGSSPEPDHGSRDSLEPSSMEASLEMHAAARLSPQQAFPRAGGPGLNRKDSLTKAQLYGTLLN